jgi:hypothetical protein
MVTKDGRGGRPAVSVAEVLAEDVKARCCWEPEATMFEFLFGPKDPTKDWQRPSSLRLSFDLACGELNGVGLGQPLDLLSFLGPVEDRRGLSTGEYRYGSLGLSVGCHNEARIIDCFDIVQKDPYSPQYRPFSGSCHHQGVILDLGRLTDDAFTKAFGSPFWRDTDQDEIILFYEFPNREWQVEFALDGTFNRIVVTGKPLLADEQQRNAYGVNKPWPPR